MKYPENFINKIICGDCLEVMKDIPDKSIDLVVTDPPYNVKKDIWDNIGDLSKFINWGKMWITECHRVLKQNGSFYMFGSVWYLPFLFVEAVKTGFRPRNQICWYYENAMTRFRNNFNMAFDPIAYFVKSNKFVFNYDEIREPYRVAEERRKIGVLKNGKRWYPNPNGRLMKNVIKINALVSQYMGKERILIDGETAHPTQKPEELIKVFIKASSNEENLILDPFGGSGTTAVACKKTNRNYILIEISPEYCKIAEERLKKVPERLDNILRMKP